MYAQLIYFDGPRSAELVAASERAGRERITPAIEGDEQLRDQLVACSCAAMTTAARSSSRS